MMSNNKGLVVGMFSAIRFQRPGFSRRLSIRRTSPVSNAATRVYQFRLPSQPETSCGNGIRDFECNRKPGRFQPDIFRPFSGSGGHRGQDCPDVVEGLEDGGCHLPGFRIQAHIPAAHRQSIFFPQGGADRILSPSFPIPIPRGGSAPCIAGSPFDQA